MIPLDYRFRRIKILRKQRLTETLLPRLDKSLVPNLILSKKKGPVFLWNPRFIVWEKAEMEYWKRVLSTPQRDKHSLTILCPYWTNKKGSLGLKYESIQTSKFMLKLAAVGQLLTLRLPKSRKT